MTEQAATVELADATVEAVVLRAVPCEQHQAYELGCPNCLTGAEAKERGVKQKVEDLGVVSRMKVKRWWR